MEYPSCYDPAPKRMTLGGVQYGLDYGIVNAHVALCVKNKFGLSYKDIPDKDYQKVIEYIDTAVAYSDSEKNLFSNLQSILMRLMSNEALDDLTSSRPFVNAKALNTAIWRINV